MAESSTSHAKNASARRGNNNNNNSTPHSVIIVSPTSRRLDSNLSMHLNMHRIESSSIDVAESDECESEEDSDWVSSDYQGSQLASTRSRSDSLTLLSDGGVIREDLPYIVTSLGNNNNNRRAGSQRQKQAPPGSSRQASNRSGSKRKDAAADDELQIPLDRKSFDEERGSFNGAGVTEIVVTLFNRKHAGLLFSLAFASMLTSCLKRGVLPLMQAELEMQPYQVDAAKILLMLPWCFGLVIGFCSDLFPIRGSHHKAYMVISWLFTVLALSAMVVLNNSNNFGGKLQSDSTLEESDRIAIVGGYVALLGVACFGGISSVIVAEIYVVALSQREVLKKRGHVIGTFLLTQFFFEGVGQVITDTVVFHTTKAGKMDPFYSLQDVLIFLVCYSMIPIPVLCYFFNDYLESTGGRIGECELLEDDDDEEEGGNAAGRFAGLWEKVKRHWLLLWKTLEENATWSVVRFLCIFVFFTEFTLRYPYAVLDKWVGVTAKTTSTGKIFTEAMYLLSALVWLLFFLNRNWNNFVIASYLGVFLFPSMTYFLASAFGGYLDIHLYMFMNSLQGFVRGIAIILEVAMVVEIAPRGGEGALMGTIVCMATIMRLVSETFSNSIGWLFGTQFLSSSTGTTAKDEPMLVATALILCYTIRLLALIGVLFLPSQKIQLLRMRFVGGRKRARAWFTVAILVISVLTASIVNSLVITPDTMCLHAFGGKGCNR